MVFALYSINNPNVFGVTVAVCTFSSVVKDDLEGAISMNAELSFLLSELGKPFV